VLLYDPEDEVECWWRIATQGAVENVAVLPGSASDDLVYYIVNRTVGGVTRRFIERFASRDACVGGPSNQQADCFVAYAGAPTATIALPQLPNTPVVVWADGASLGTAVTDAAGNAAMPDGLPHAAIVAGLPYTAQFQSSKLAYASQSGSALTKKKRIADIGLVMFDAQYLAVEFGPDFLHLDPLPLVEDAAVTASTTVWSEYDKPLISFPGTWDTDTRLCLQAQAPNPVKIGGVVIVLEEVDG
jgi:hypothetical protein